MVVLLSKHKYKLGFGWKGIVLTCCHLIFLLYIFIYRNIIEIFAKVSILIWTLWQMGVEEVRVAESRVNGDWVYQQEGIRWGNIAEISGRSHGHWIIEVRWAGDGMESLGQVEMLEKESRWETYSSETREKEDSVDKGKGHVIFWSIFFLK